MVSANWRRVALACIASFVIYVGLALWTDYGVVASEEVDLPANIDRIELRSDSNLILLEVLLIEPSTCSDVVKDLKLGNLIISERVFVPVCEVISELHYRIKYKETLSI